MISLNIGAMKHTGLQLNHSKEILTILLYSGSVTGMIQNYFWKTAISVKSNDEKSFQQLISVFSFFKLFASQYNLNIFKGKFNLNTLISVSIQCVIIY